MSCSARCFPLAFSDIVAPLTVSFLLLSADFVFIVSSLFAETCFLDALDGIDDDFEEDFGSFAEGPDWPVITMSLSLSSLMASLTGSSSISSSEDSSIASASLPQAFVALPFLFAFGLFDLPFSTCFVDGPGRAVPDPLLDPRPDKKLVKGFSALLGLEVEDPALLRVVRLLPTSLAICTPCRLSGGKGEIVTTTCSLLLQRMASELGISPSTQSATSANIREAVGKGNTKTTIVPAA